MTNGGKQKNPARAIVWTLCIASGLLSAFAYAPLEWRYAAWVAPALLFIAVPWIPARRVFVAGWATGLLHWGLSIFWLTRVTWPGWFLLAAYCALYTGALAWIVRRLSDRTRWWWLLAPVAGAGLEYLRSTLATGFAWNAWGVSQYRDVLLIQCADLGGVYAVSFILLAFNAALAATVHRYVRQRGHWGRRPHYEMMAGLLILAAAYGYGRVRLHREFPRDDPLRIGLIQPGIAQQIKWTEEELERIRGQLRTLSHTALQTGPLNLVVWPETALPDFLREDAEGFEVIQSIATQGVYLLAGAMDYEWSDDLPPRPRYFNSSFLIDPRGRIIEQYDKQHLVLFGEYVPLEQVFPFLKTFTPIDGSFTPGREATVFKVDGKAFSILICFEDTVAPLARKAVRAGARLLINQTNDAWFDPLSGSLQHMAHSVFRAVENRTPVVRCANTGVSAWIDASGRIRQELRAADGSPQTAGFLTAPVNVPPSGRPLTFYTRRGDVFGIMCSIVVFALVLSSRCWRAKGSG